MLKGNKQKVNSLVPKKSEGDAYITSNSHHLEYNKWNQVIKFFVIPPISHYLLFVRT